MKLEKSKKGTASENWSSDTIMFWMITGVVLGFVALFVLLFFTKTSSAQTIVPKYLETNLLFQRFLKSPSCFVYQKDDIIINGVIDLDKFNQKTLGSCYHTESRKFPAMRIILTSSTLSNIEPIYTKNWLSNSGFESKTYPYSVKIYSGEKFHNGEATIEIQNSK